MIIKEATQSHKKKGAHKTAIYTTTKLHLNPNFSHLEEIYRIER
jgi:hypothetical protein